MEISGVILKDDAMTEVEGSKCSYIHELVEECLQGVIFAPSEDYKDSPAVSPFISISTSPTLALIFSMTDDHDNALKLDL